MATFFSHFFYLFLACLISVYVATTSFDLYYEKPGPSEQEQLLIINKGQSVASIASHLKELNLIESRMVFILVVRLKGFHDKIKFGEYMIPKTASIKDILDAVRLKLIDWSVDLFSPKTKKDIDKIDQVSYTTTKFNSTKVVLSNNSKYPSLYHAVKKESSVNVLFDNDLFWSDIDHFYIYNNHHAKRTTQKNTRRSSSFRSKA